jgi:hypothetical protein
MEDNKNEKIKAAIVNDEKETPKSKNPDNIDDIIPDEVLETIDSFMILTTFFLSQEEATLFLKKLQKNTLRSLLINQIAKIYVTDKKEKVNEATI